MSCAGQGGAAADASIVHEDVDGAERRAHFPYDVGGGIAFRQIGCYRQSHDEPEGCGALSPFVEGLQPLGGPVLSVGLWQIRAGSATDRADEAVTPLRYRFDVLRILSQGFAQDKDVVGEIAFLDKGVGPKSLDKFSFLEQMASIADQKHQGVKCLRRKNYLFVAPR